MAQVAQSIQTELRVVEARTTDLRNGRNGRTGRTGQAAKLKLHSTFHIVSLRQSMASRDWTWCYPWSLSRLINSISRKSTRNLPFPSISSAISSSFLGPMPIEPFFFRYVPTLIPSWIWSTRPTVFISSSCTWPKMSLGCFMDEYGWTIYGDGSKPCTPGEPQNSW